LRAMPWWDIRSYANPANVIAAMLFAGFATVGFAVMPPLWAALALIVPLYWPVDRALMQAKASGVVPIAIHQNSKTIDIRGERFPQTAVEGIECVRVPYGKGGGEFGPIDYHEVHAIVSTDPGLRRVLIVDEGMNSERIAAQLARMIGCALRKVEVAGPDK
jgi:hypothetical protein